MTGMGRKTERMGEKSSFAVTCSLLSQYIKEKGGLGDLGLGMAPTRPPVEEAITASAKGKSETFRQPTTMSLLPGVDVSDGANTKDDVSVRDVKTSMELFPQSAGFGPSVLAADDAREAADVRKPEKEQLTIFYGGKVLVFDNFPEEKARELMQLASKGSPAIQNFGFVPSSPASAAATAAAADRPNHHSNGGSTFVPTSGNPTPAQRPTQPSASFLPMARKASLHRFLEKRKDRINAKPPYHTNGSTVKTEASQPWLGLGPQILKPTLSSECSR